MIRKEIGEAEMFPRGYGMAWYGVGFRIVCYPIPLNLLMRALWHGYCFLKRGKRGFEMSKAEAISQWHLELERNEALRARIEELEGKL